MIKLCIFDLDDTLINTLPLYLERIEVFDKQMQRLGFDKEEVNMLRYEIDRKAIKKEGVPITRFPQSFYDTYKILCEKYGIPFNEIRANNFRNDAYKVFTAISPLFPYTKAALNTLLNDGYEMIILTRGDKTVQLRRVLDVGLANYFDNIFVVSKKTTDVFNKLCSFYEVNKNEVVMIGNSMIGDIAPALEAGLFGIFAQNGTFELENNPNPLSNDQDYSDKLFVCKNIQATPEILNRINNNE